MNEQRTQAYLNLVNQLLSCYENDELRILQSNQELWDQDLIKVILSVSRKYGDAGRENEAKRLIKMAGQVAKKIGLLEDNASTASKTKPNSTSSLEDESKKYIDFIRQLQNLTNPYELEKYLRDNQHLLNAKLIETIRNIFQVLADNGLHEAAQEIAYLEEILMPFLDDTTVERATDIAQQDSLLLSQDKAEEYHQFFMETLQLVYDNPNVVYPYLTQNLDKLNENLIQIMILFARRTLKQVDRRESHNIALDILNFSDLITTFSLGNIAVNKEIAITGYTIVLTVFSHEAYPQKWALTQNSLASAYYERIKGDKEENLEIAIASFQKALIVYTFKAFPQEWAGVQNNLATAYNNRIRGDEVENLEMAIAAYQNALRVYTFDVFPYEWALTQNNLATAYRKRIREDKSENLEKAIACYNEALRVRTFDVFPQDWAITQNNLVIAYIERIMGNKAENLELAITACQNTLKVYTFDAFPDNWAMAQNNLAYAYSQKIEGDKAENLKNAITAYENALIIHQTSPQTCLKTARNLGDLGYKNKKWKIAIKGYLLALEAAENLRSEALTDDRKEGILSDAIQVYYRIVHTYLNLYHHENNSQYLKTALEYIEGSKTRNLIELMMKKNMQPKGVDQATTNKLNELRQKVVNEQKRIEMKASSYINNTLQPYVRDYRNLKKYQQELDNFIKDKISKHDPTFCFTQKFEPIAFSEIQSLIDPETCLVQWYITEEKILVFIMSSDGAIKLWESSETDLQKLRNTINKYLPLYKDYRDGKNDQWINQLPEFLKIFADTLYINEIIALIPNTCKRLIIIPHRSLHILPIHALPINGNRQKNYILQDKYDVQYAPSCQVFQITQKRQLYNLTHLFAIQNPTEDRPFVDFGVEAIRHLFSPHDYILSGNQATKNNLLQNNKLKISNCFHFFGHGEYNGESPLESALILANDETLTLGEIFDLKLEQCRLVILSACETGMTNINNHSDEYTGLPSGFLFAGSPNVISTLWIVDSVSTAFLMIELYENLSQQSKQNKIDVAIALKQAQRKLRDMTNEQFKQRLNQYKPHLDMIVNQLSNYEQTKINSMLNYRQSKPYPFSDPFDWAAFVSIGR